MVSEQEMNSSYRLLKQNQNDSFPISQNISLNIDKSECFKDLFLNSEKDIKIKKDNTEFQIIQKSTQGSFSFNDSYGTEKNSKTLINKQKSQKSFSNFKQEVIPKKNLHSMLEFTLANEGDQNLNVEYE